MIYTTALAISVAWGCKKPYAPPVTVSNASYLVVEGIINSGADSTYIRLSRTVSLSNPAAPGPELGATVTVESDQNAVYPLLEAGSGLYSSAALNLPATGKYRLRVRTTNGKEYLSDFVPAQVTPPIDSITYDVQNNGVQFYANTHDPANNTHYYRWDFDETYQYISLNQSFYTIDATGAPTYRLGYNSYDDIYHCYKTNQSQQVLLGSSAKLAQDRIYRQPVDFIAAESGKISHGYSILLRQYALTSDAFAYWQILKKNTEQLGSIFDAQPSTLQGNIHCVTDAKEPVIGYISASSVTAMRVYVDNYFASLFVPDYLAPPDLGACPVKIIQIAPAESFLNRLNNVVGKGDSLLINSVSPPGIPIITGYKYAWIECVDCRTKEPFGTNVKPVYWPY